jgi:hypothetical protein
MPTVGSVISHYCITDESTVFKVLFGDMAHAYFKKCSKIWFTAKIVDQGLKGPKRAKKYFYHIHNSILLQMITKISLYNFNVTTRIVLNKF